MMEIYWIWKAGPTTDLCFNTIFIYFCQCKPCHFILLKFGTPKLRYQPCFLLCNQYVSQGKQIFFNIPLYLFLSSLPNHLKTSILRVNEWDWNSAVVKRRLIYKLWFHSGSLELEWSINNFMRLVETQGQS